MRASKKKNEKKIKLEKRKQQSNVGAKEGTLATNYSGNTGACGDSVEAHGRRPDCRISVRSLRDRAACLAAVCQATERQQRRWGRVGGAEGKRAFLTAAPCGSGQLAAEWFV